MVGMERRHTQEMAREILVEQKAYSVISMSIACALVRWWTY